VEATLNVDELKTHIGRKQLSTDVVTAAPANLLRLALARPEPELTPGDALPPGWHVLYFLPRLRPDELRADGTPAAGGVVPDMPLPRRMFAGETFRFHRPLRIGESLRREIELSDISLKSGGTGALVFTTVLSRIFGPDGLAVEEERRIVYREEVKAGEGNQAPRREPAPADVPWRRTITPDPVLLFRFSALTFNSHRIHYDRRWATDVEGYPGLVVHGPLTQTLLIDFARDHTGGRRFVSWITQARAPLFEPAPFELRGRPTANGCELWAVTPEGTVAMSAIAELA
jgi:3-methylfumaryl-CoA hydratase